MLKEGTLLLRRVGSLEDTGCWATVEVEWAGVGVLITAPSNPKVLNPQAPPPSPKPPGAHALRLNDRESPAGHLFLTIGKHLVSLNVLHLPHPFFQPLPQRTSPNRGRRGSQGGPPLESAGMGGVERQETRPAGPAGQVSSPRKWVCISWTLEVLESGPGCFKSPGGQKAVTRSSYVIQRFGPGNQSHPSHHCASHVMTEHPKETLSSLNLRSLDVKWGQTVESSSLSHQAMQ